MKKLLEFKLTIVLLASGGLVALALLAVALRDFAFQAPKPFSLNLIESLPVLADSESTPEMPFWLFLLLGVFLLTMFVISLILLDAATRKRVLFAIFRFVITLLVIWIVMNFAYKRGSLQQLVDQIPAPAAGGGVTFTQTSAPEFTPPQLNYWFVLAVSFGVSLFFVLLVWFIYSHRSRRYDTRALDEIAGIARQALNGLQPGRNWEDAILLAYIRMNEVVTIERGLIRQPGTTPSEFAHRMERVGLPGEAVGTLTHLFEGVRYGGKSASQADRDLAAAALNAILHACGVNL